MRISKVLISLLTLGATSGTIGGYYFLEKQQTQEEVKEEARKISDKDKNSLSEKDDGADKNLVDQKIESESINPNSGNNTMSSNEAGETTSKKNEDISIAKVHIALPSKDIVAEIKPEQKVVNKEEEKNFTGKLLFSLDNANTNLSKVAYFFYSGTLLDNESYKEKEKSWESEKKEVEDINEIYTENISFDISSPINKKTAEDYLSEENSKLKISVTSPSVGQGKPIQELKKYIENNSDKFKSIFGDNFYSSLLVTLDGIISPNKVSK